jgi:hypothetical protein
VRVNDTVAFQLVADPKGSLSADMLRPAPEGSAVFETLVTGAQRGVVAKDLSKARSPFGGRSTAPDGMEGRVSYTPSSADQTTAPPASSAEGEGTAAASGTAHSSAAAPDGGQTAVVLAFGFGDVDSIQAQLRVGDEVEFDIGQCAPAHLSTPDGCVCSALVAAAAAAAAAAASPASSTSPSCGCLIVPNELKLAWSRALT